MTTLLAHKLFTNCNSSHLLQHTVTHIFFVFYTVQCALRPSHSAVLFVA